MTMMPPSSRCPECGTHVENDSSCCLECGVEIASCQICNSSNITSAEFCHACGGCMVADEEDPREIYCQEAKLVSYQDPRALDEALLAIVKLRGGVISLSETCSFLGVSMEDLMDSIDRLQRSRGLVLE